MTIFEKYLHELNAIRANRSLPYTLRFKPKAGKNDGGETGRMRVAVALYNDLRVEDYGLVRFLFTEELKMRRRYYATHHMHNLRFMALMLGRFGNPEDVWLLFDVHQLDRDFEIEFVFFPGVNRVLEYLKTASHKNKRQLARKIAVLKADPNLQYYISEFTKSEVDYFSEYNFTPGNDLKLAALLNEKAYVKKMLPAWANEQSQWTFETARDYVHFANEYSNDNRMKQEALEILTTHFGNEPDTFIHKFDLGKLYFKEGKNEDALVLLTSMLKCAPDYWIEKIVRLIGKIIIRHDGISPEKVKQSIDLLNETAIAHEASVKAAKKIISEANQAAERYMV
jgi:hypothetical protein